MDDEQSPTLDEWRRLYDAFAAIKELAPWEFMEEDEIFALENPENGDVGFVSVMGSLGEHFAVAVYLGVEALYRFWAMQEMGPALRPEFLLETPQLQASFEDREELEQEDRAVIKDLGRKYRGRGAWPLFRSYRPGYLPWFLSGAEARFLTHALEQLQDVAGRLQEDEELLDPEDDITYLVRVPEEKDGRLTWHDEQREFPPPEDESIEFAVSTQLLAKFKKLKQRRGHLEVDLFLMPTPIGEKGEQAYFPHLLMIVDPQSGMIIGNEMLQPFPSPTEMRNEAIGTLLALLVAAGFRPSELATSSLELADRLEAIADELNVEVGYVSYLPTLEMVREDLLSFLNR